MPNLVNAAEKDPYCNYDEARDGPLPDLDLGGVSSSVSSGNGRQAANVLYPALNEVDAYEGNEQTSHVGWNDVWVENANGLILTLPGRGEPGPFCGEWRYGVRCSNPNDPLAVMRGHVYSCHRPVCPECLYSAANQKALSIWRTFQGKSLVLTAEAEQAHRYIGKKKQIQFSYSPDLLTPADLLDREKLRLINRELDRVLDAAFADGWYAGFLVFHAYRLQRVDGTFAGEGDLMESSEPVNLRDIFKGLTPVWGPHWHFVGYGYVMPAGEFAETFPEWRYKRIKEAKLPGKNNQYAERDVVATARYLLTHHAVFMDRLVVPKRIGLSGETTTEFSQHGQSYRWVGEFRPHKIAKQVLDSKLVPRLCEHCGAEMHIYPMDLDGHVCEDESLARVFRERLEKVVYYRVDRKAPDRGRSQGVIVDELSDHEHLVPIAEQAGWVAPATACDSVSARYIPEFSGDYDPNDHEMWNWC